MRTSESRKPPGIASFNSRWCYDVVIVGGGPAGLSTALVLGRCRRRVLLVDSGCPRNRFAAEIHGYLTRDAESPAEFLRIGRAELARYDIEVRSAEAKRARREDGRFVVTLDDGAEYVARRLVLATGLVDEIPQIEGVAERYGASIHHCPYCDGWEHRDQALAALGPPDAAPALALSLRTWSRDVVVLTNGPAEIDEKTRRKLAREEIPVIDKPIARVEGEGHRLERIVFTDGAAIARNALFFSAGCRQASDLPAQLGCRFDAKGGVVTDDRERTRVEGLYLVGDASRDVQFVIVAAAEGATAAVALNAELQREEVRGRAPEDAPRAADVADAGRSGVAAEAATRPVTPTARANAPTPAPDRSAPRAPRP